MAERESTSTSVRLGVIESRLGYIAQRCDDTYKEVTSHFVPLERYQVLENDVKLIKSVVFGFIGLVLVAVAGALIALVVK